MVSYQTFTSIAFDVADEKGAQFAGIEEGGQFIQQVAAVWNQRTDEFRQMTEQQARAELNQLVTA
jgi:hypothetical protein